MEGVSKIVILLTASALCGTWARTCYPVGPLNALHIMEERKRIKVDLILTIDYLYGF